MSFHKFLGYAAWLVTGLAAMHLGAMALGYDALSSLTPDNLKIVHLVVGAFGVMSLVMFAMMCTCGGCGKCGTSGCTCK